MTRAENRRLERSNLALDKTITITQRELNRRISAAAEEVTRKALYDNLLPNLHVALRRTMNDKFGFGKVRWNRLMIEWNRLFDCIYEDKVSIEDLRELEREEKGA